MTGSLQVDIERRVGDFALAAKFSSDKDITVVFGPSGSGKTMLLDTIAGLERPSGGSIKLGGETLFHYDATIDLPPEKRKVGYVFQSGRLFPHLNVNENLRFGERLLKTEERRISFDDVIDVLGIEPLLERSTHRLSGGEQQRVAIGRALMSSPQLILMDEPLASLDPLRRQEILPFVEMLKDEFAIPIVYVSHSLDEVVRLGDRVVLLDQGTQVAVGTVDDVLNRAELRDHFGLTDIDPAGTPQTILSTRLSEQDMTFGLTRLHGHGLSLWVPAIERPIGSTVRLKLRASDIALSLQQSENTSIINQFFGDVQEICEPTIGHVDVRLRHEGGVEVWARITRKSAARLEIKTGQSLWAMVKSVAVVTGTPTPNFASHT